MTIIAKNLWDNEVLLSQPSSVARIDNAKYIEEVFLSPNLLIDKSIKTRTLNAILGELKILMSTITNSTLMSQAVTLESIIEDGFNISMYKFQFKIFTKSLAQELKILEDNIKLGL